MAQEHAHSAASRNKRKLVIVFGLTTTHLVAEVVGGRLRRRRSGEDTAERKDNGLRHQDKEDLSSCGRVSGDPGVRTREAPSA
jgi:hypothetical protein